MVEGYGTYSEGFARYGIDGKQLLLISEESQLKQLGFTDKILAKNLLRQIGDLSINTGMNLESSLLHQAIITTTLVLMRFNNLLQHAKNGDIEGVGELTYFLIPLILLIISFGFLSSYISHRIGNQIGTNTFIGIMACCILMELIYWMLFLKYALVSYHVKLHEQKNTHKKTL